MLAGSVEPHEPITRFIHSSEHFAAQTGRVKPAALLPALNRATQRLESSVYRASGASSEELWAICAEHVDITRRMKARGTTAAEHFLAAGLQFDPDGKPHPRHANVIEWPLPKHEQKILAQKIAATMVLELRPSDS